jgi:LemA protein
MRRGTIAAIVLIGGALVVAGSCASQYNRLVALDQQVDSQWAQVENAYQRRLDLVPNLVETVKGAARFEQQTFTQVAQARSQAAAVTREAQAEGKSVSQDPATLQKYQAAQDQLGGALGRLMVVAERYPELKATENFRDLQAQLEGTENRIAVERMRFNDAARQFNTKRDSFPTTIVAGMFGSKFKPKAYFTAQAGAQTAPHVNFQ